MQVIISNQQPPNWNTVELAHCGTWLSGGTPSTANKEYWDGEIPWITSSSLNKFLLKDSERKVTELGIKNGTRLVPVDTIVFVVRGMSLKKEFRVGISQKQIAFGQDCKAIIPKEEIHPLFLAYQLKSREAAVLNLVDEASHGTGRLQTNLLKQLKILLPPLPEQRKIAAILSTWDEAIDLTQQLIDAKQRRKKGLMQQLLTGKVRFSEFDKEWEYLRAGDVFASISIKKNGEEELLSVTQDKGVLPRSMLEGRVMSPDGSTDGYKLVVPGNFVISLRSFQGGLEYSEYRGLVSPAYTVLKPKKEINNDFYKYFFKSYEFIGRLAIAVIGIRDGKQISYSDFCTLKLPYPSILEQQRIAEVLSVCDEEIALLQQKLAALQKQKKGLMQQLLTGKTRVTV